MLFNSYEFIFFFLPIVVTGFYFATLFKRRAIVIWWLLLSSLFFYAWWSPPFLILILSSLVFNYHWAKLLCTSKHKLLMWVGVLANLSLLGYFKYSHFFLGIFLHQSHWFLLQKIILPLGISFFTFQQLVLLLDVYRGKEITYKFSEYSAFVVFFPHLIAGPIMRHDELVPQFQNNKFEVLIENIFLGLSIFSVGLFKKVVIADKLGQFASPVFAVSDYSNVSFIVAWCAALAFTFQIYFDFSAYSNMATGLARLFGITLTLNFNSPYKTTNIIDFWRCWHITLSRFLKNYLYVPLGGNRGGEFRKHINLFIVMLLGGIWHGAGWTFIVWGCLHAICLIINHLWRSMGFTRYLSLYPYVTKPFCWALTFLCVVIGWVFFRAPSIKAAVNILQGMFAMPGRLLIPHDYVSLLGEKGMIILQSLGAQVDKLGPNDYYYGKEEILWIGIAMFICILLPNLDELTTKFWPTSNKVLSVRRSFLYYIGAGTLGIIFAISISMIGGKSEFLYFQF